MKCIHVTIQEQYIYLHEAVADALYFGTHVIWSRQFGDVVAFMSQKEKGENQTRLQKQFEVEYHMDQKWFIVSCIYIALFVWYIGNKYLISLKIAY